MRRVSRHKYPSLGEPDTISLTPPEFLRYIRRVHTLGASRQSVGRMLKRLQEALSACSESK